MKYFLDTEFIEGFKKPIKWLPTIGNFNKPYHSIQLISIGIVCEDGRTYYAISKEYNYNDASDWVKENVILQMYQGLTPANKQYSEPSTFHKYEGKLNSKIAGEIVKFIYPNALYNHPDCLHNQIGDARAEDAEFYAYYADYDWVVFCSIFGTMMDLPKGFPMYCRDLKQTMDEKTLLRYQDPQMPFKQKLDWLKMEDAYPKQTNEHNALDDARWNFELYKFLKQL